jgi:RNA polymerase sigma-70 factor (ECF subfamily)
MDTSFTSRTSPSLLGRLQQTPRDQTAWNDFVARYGPIILRWCRHWQLQDADAQDVTQMVLLALAQKIAAFTYNPQGSFRAWLKTLARHACSDYVDRRQRAGLGSGDSQVLSSLNSVEASDELAQHLDEEYRRELFELASRQVQLRVAAHTWEAFRLTALEGVAAAEVASRLNMRVAHVYVAKSEVLRMLREEIQKLEIGS